MTGPDLDGWAREGGVENAVRMFDGWRSRGWPGPLDPANEMVIEWAYYAEALGAEAADARVPMDVAEGCEPLLHRRQVAALAYVRRRAQDEARKRAEERRDG